MILPSSLIVHADENFFLDDFGKLISTFNMFLLIHKHSLVSLFSCIELSDIKIKVYLLSKKGSYEKIDEKSGAKIYGMICLEILNEKNSLN
jgi:hypothetical protein